MNERIKELMPRPAILLDSAIPVAVYTTDQMEKFAELIIQACAKIVDIWSDEVPCSEGYDKFTVCKLKNHFGVEE